MSKKKKAYKYFSGYDWGYGATAKKDKKKDKKDKKSYYPDPVTKTMKATLSGKAAKESRDIVQSPVKIPKKFTKNQAKCNHYAEPLTVAEYKELTPNWASYTPMLESMVNTFGESHVHVCRKCFDVVVDRDCVNAEAVDKALTTLYAAVGVAVANKKMKKDEVREVNRLKLKLRDFTIVGKLLRKIAKALTGTNSNATAKTAGDLTEEELNRVGNEAFVQ